MSSRTSRQLSVLAIVALLFTVSHAWSQAAGGPGTFAPLEQWKKSVLAGDTAALTKLFSTDPAAQVSTPKGASDANSEVAFWTGLEARTITADVVQQNSPQPGIQVVVFQAEVHTAASNTVYVTEAQAWQQQADQWRLVVVKRTEPAHLKQPTDTKKDLYPAQADARAEITEAEEKAAKEHKRVLLVFGANWCFDCHVLDLAFHRPDFAPVVARYEIVHVDIGEDGKKNADIAREFQVPLEKGVPALAVVDGRGKLLVSQKNGEFENARAMTPEAMLEFLNKWKSEAQ
jgi:hypothetical protein